MAALQYIVVAKFKKKKDWNMVFTISCWRVGWIMVLKLSKTCDTQIMNLQ